MKEPRAKAHMLSLLQARAKAENLKVGPEQWLRAGLGEGHVQARTCRCFLGGFGYGVQHFGLFS